MENREVRLIYANELLEKLNKKQAGPANARYTEGFNEAIMKFRSMIHGAPTIGLGDLWPHAKWTKDHTCTNCGEFALEAPEAHCYYHTIYCPHCGAFMDKED